MSEAARALLLNRRRDLLRQWKQATELADEAMTNHEIETIDQASDQWDARVMSQLGDRETQQLADVVAALRRLTAGTYGICVRCGGKIDPARLRVMPEASKCTSCASYVEHRRRA